MSGRVRISYTCFHQLNNQTAEEKSRLGNQKNYSTMMRATCGGGGSSERARKTDSIESLAMVDRRVLEYTALDYLRHYTAGPCARGGLWRRHFAQGDRFD